MCDARLLILCVCVLIAGGFGEDAFNKMIDRALDKLEKDLNNKTRRLVVTLPDVDVPFKKNFLWMDLYGSVELRGGSVLSMAGLRKVGEATLVQTNGGDVQIAVDVSWSDLALGYVESRFKYLFFDISDSIKFSVKKNVVFLKSTFHYGTRNKCQMSLNAADLMTFQGFSSQLGPPAWYKFFNNYIVDFFLKDQSEEIMSAINKQLTQDIDNIVDQLNLCRYLPY